MNTIKENVSNTLEIKKSTFICELIKIKDINEVNYYLNSVKTKYKDATHYCYCYIIDNIIKASDDNEPSKTAGIPIMEVLTKNNLNNILCIVIRYFGGIKLGASGLIRAYSNSVRDCLKKAIILKQEDGYEIEIITDYSNQKELDYLIKDFDVKKEYNEQIRYIIKCNKDFLDILNNKKINYNIIDKIKIEF